MAVLCAKCGAEVPAGSHFCAACGTPVLAAAASAPQAAPAYTPVNVPSQPTAGAQAATGSQPLPGYTPAGGVPPAGYAPAGSYTQPPAAPVKSGGSALKIILIIFAVLVGLGILGAGAVGFTVWRVARAFHVNGKNGQVTLNTPSGSVTASNASNFTADELGTDIYPGALSVRGGAKINLPGSSMVTAVYVTSDSKDKVLDFYKSRMGGGASVYDAEESAVLTAKKGDKESVMVTISSKPSEADGKTKIAIMHTKSK